MTAPLTRRIVLAGGVLALAGCAGAQAAGDSTALTVVLDWTPNTNHTGLYLAQQEGWFEDAGLDVRIIEPGETSGLQLVATGQADVAYSVAESLLPARAAGADVVSIATVIEKNTSSLISLAQDGITRPRDLEGMRYGSYGSDLENAIIGDLVACDGGDPALVESVPLASADFRIGLTEDQFDTAWVFDAWDTIRLGELDGLEVSTLAFRDYTDCIPNWYTPLIATSATQIEERPEVLAAFMEALSRGYATAMEDPERGAAALMAAAPELEPELVSRSAAWLADAYAPSPEMWGVQDAATWETFHGWLVEGGMLDGDARIDAAWTNSLLAGQG